MASIADLHVELAQRIAARLGAPRVHAFHLPPPTTRKSAEFCAMELEEGDIGFAYIRLPGTEGPLRERYGAGGVADREAFLEAFRRGAKWGDYADKYVLARADYPGLESLLSRIG